MPNSAPSIHPTALIGPDVTLAPGVTIGPYCVLSGSIHIGGQTVVLSHTVIEGSTRIGSGCRIGPSAAIGTPPQHGGYEGQETFAVIEDGVTVREFATVHRAMKPGLEHATRVGAGTTMMVGSHVGHDAQVGQNVTLANSVHLGGHVTVGERAFIGGGCVIHQFVRIGRLVMIRGGEAISKDVMPFGSVSDRHHRAYNAVGCRRAGLSPTATRGIRAAFHLLHASQSATIGAKRLRLDWAQLVPEVRELVEFIEGTHRGIEPSGKGGNTAAND